MKEKSKGFWPALTLFFLAPAIGELLSGSAPPAEFFNPFSLLVLCALYGSGAILIRELRVRWKKGWPTLLALGAAYGILEEGLMVKSFFDPNWMDLGVLGEYGRWAGVNWVWSLELILYHAVVSITIPILLVELLFPAQRGSPWLGRRGMVFHTSLLSLDVIFGFLALTTYRPPFLPYCLAILAMLLLYWLARRMPAGLGAQLESSKSAPGNFKLFVLGLGVMLAFFFINWVLPNLKIPVLLTMAADIGLASLVWRRVGKLSRYHAWGDQQRLALACGALTFFILLAPLQELDKTRADNPAGMLVVALATLLFLIGVWRKIASQSAAENRPKSSPQQLTPAP